MPASRPNAKRQQTIDSQLSALRGWVNAQGHVLADAHVFRDEGFSGSRLDRPALDALRDAIRDSVVDVVAVFTPDRLARKYAYQVLLMEEFRRADCEVVFLHHPISDDPNDQLLLQIQGAIAEYERGRGSNQVTLETRKPLAGAALTGSRVTRKRHFSNHAGFRTKPTNDRNETIC